MLRKVIRSWVMGHGSWVKSFRLPIFCIASGIILALPFSFGKLWILAWFGFVPLFFALRNKTPGQRFFLAYLTGIVFWWGTIYWLVNVTFVGTFVLILYLSLYFGFFGLSFFSTDYGLRTTDLFLISSLWVLLEYARSHALTGFPWALLGYSQYLNLPAIQIADITGAWGVSFVVMMGNVMVYRSWVMGYGSWVKKTRNNILIGILILILSLIYGYLKLYSRPRTQDTRPVKISVVQGNIPQELKWEPSARDFILQRYAGLTAQSAKDAPDLIIWPEAASPGLFPEDAEVFRQIFPLAEAYNTPLLIGTVAQEGEKYFNSALLIGTTGQVISRYDKLHLVPFGEYIPLKKALPFLQAIVPIGDINAGREYTIFEIRNPKSEIRNKSKIQNSKSQTTTNFAVLICFEDLFPELSREFVRRGADFLVNITNDAWYKKTSAPYQHFQASVFRAVENRAYVARAANTGVSGFISPQGKIIALARDAAAREIFVEGYATQEFNVAKKSLSVYSRYGDIFIILCAILCLAGVINRPLRRKKVSA
ncbi:MAG: apolipoprotein N-acyltransferase [Candidatus Omnitrophota bacterium]|nr:apolipoprotein N-acyltransferase [Candidatus Omnitrophota bacterium]